MFIFLLSPNKKKKITQYSSLPLCLFFDYPETRKKKFTQYSSLPNSSTVNIYIYIYIFIYLFILKKVLEPGRLEYCVNGTRVYKARVSQKFFLITQIQLSNVTVEN